MSNGFNFQTCLRSFRVEICSLSTALAAKRGGPEKNEVGPPLTLFKYVGVLHLHGIWMCSRGSR